jgi:transcription elongation factor GreA
MEELDITNSQSVLLTPGGHKRLQEELQHLTVNKRSEIAERIRESKEHGEYSEDNSELDEIKQEQAIVESRIAELKNIFSNADIIDSKEIPTDHVGFGTKVTVKDDERNIEFTVRIVSSVEANPDEDFISEESPMGQALLDKKVGDVATYQAPAGEIAYKIVKLDR